MQATRSGRWGFSLASGLGGLNALRNDWEGLLASVPGANYLQSPRWFASYLDALAPSPDRVHFIAARRAGMLDAVFVLESTALRFAGLGLPSLRLITGDHMHLSDIALRPGAEGVWAGFAEWLNEQRELPWQVLTAEGVCNDSALARLLGTAEEPLRSIVRPRSPTAWLDCSQGIALALPRVKRCHTANVKRLNRRARKLGSLSYEAVTDAGQLDDALNEFLVVEASGWKGDAGSAIQGNTQLRAFYGRLMSEFGQIGACRINLLRLNGQVIAAQFGLISNRQLNLLKIGYSHPHAHLAPGHLIMQHTIESVCADPALTRLSFVTNPRWAHLWKPESTPANCHLFFRGSLVGSVLFRAAQAWLSRPRVNAPGAAGA